MRVGIATGAGGGGRSDPAKGRRRSSRPWARRPKLRRAAAGAGRAGAGGDRRAHAAAAGGRASRCSRWAAMRSRASPSRWPPTWSSGERPADSRFDARKGRDLPPMVGRDQELALLLERWAQAQGGEGQAVLLVGEAGIGKSRLARALLDACAAAAASSAFCWQCSPYHTGSALWPVIQRLSRSAGLLAQDSTDAALDKLEALTGRDKEAAALYATLLGLDGSQRYGPLDDDAADAARAHAGGAGRAAARAWPSSGRCCWWSKTRTGSTRPRWS